MIRAFMAASAIVRIDELDECRRVAGIEVRRSVRGVRDDHDLRALHFACDAVRAGVRVVEIADQREHRHLDLR